ncbi:MAG: hypothetical protein U0K22_06360, partial [Acutalibacteraceae bacterium]|nr:hypothetical protein [Acutalibacteraceae bacterium]
YNSPILLCQDAAAFAKASRRHFFAAQSAPKGRSFSFCRKAALKEREHIGIFIFSIDNGRKLCYNFACL